MEWYRTRPWFSFALLLALMLLVLVLWLLAKGEGEIWPRDFEVFYTAGERAAAGENLYRPVEDGFYHYKYSPVAALLFAPLTLLPLDAAGAVFRLFLILIFLAGLYLAMRMCDPRFPPEGYGAAVTERVSLANRTVLLAALALSMQFYSELTLGQVNQIVIVAGLACALLVARKRMPWLASALLALGVFIKPLLLIFLPYLLLRRRWRVVAGFLVFAGALFALPVMRYGVGGMLSQNRGWLDALTEQVWNSRNLLAAGNHTIFSFLARVTPLRWLLEGAQGATVYRVLLLACVAFLVLWLLRRGELVGNREALDFAMMMLLVPLLVYVSENGFGFVELAVVLLLFNSGSESAAEKTILAAGLLLFWLGTLVSQISGPVIDQVLSTIHDWSLITAGTLMFFLLLGIDRYRRML